MCRVLKKILKVLWNWAPVPGYFLKTKKCGDTRITIRMEVCLV